MAYIFVETRRTHGGQIEPLSEQHYCYDNDIYFTHFDSCIGVVAKVNNTLCGIHLVLAGFDINLPPNLREPTCTWFNAFVAQEIRYRLFRNSNQEMLIVGYYKLWEGGGLIAGAETFGQRPNNDIINGYRRLKFGFVNVREEYQRQENQKYRVYLNHGHIEFGYY